MTISINLNSEARDELYLSAHFGGYMDMSSYFLTGMSSSSKKLLKKLEFSNVLKRSKNRFFRLKIFEIFWSSRGGGS